MLIVWQCIVLHRKPKSPVTTGLFLWQRKGIEMTPIYKPQCQKVLRHMSKFHTLSKAWDVLSLCPCWSKGFDWQEEDQPRINHSHRFMVGGFKKKLYNQYKKEIEFFITLRLFVHKILWTIPIRSYNCQAVILTFLLNGNFLKVFK